MLELVNVSKIYDSPGGGGGLCVLRDITLKVEQGEAMAVVGPSGSGKSTLLNLIGCLDRPSSGRVELDGRDVGRLAEKQLAAIRNSEIGFVFQLHHLLPQCTVLENVLVPTLAAGRRGGKETVQKRAMDLLERVGLDGLSTYRPGELSVGQRQRVAVVRALINKPRLLLADEPTGSLDREAAENIAGLLVELNRVEGVTLLVVTHSMRLAGHTGRVFELSNGLLKEKGKSE